MLLDCTFVELGSGSRASAGPRSDLVPEVGWAEPNNCWAWLSLALAFALSGLLQKLHPVWFDPF